MSITTKDLQQKKAPVIRINQEVLRNNLSAMSAKIWRIF